MSEDIAEKNVTKITEVYRKNEYQRSSQNIYHPITKEMCDPQEDHKAEHWLLKAILNEQPKNFTEESSKIDDEIPEKNLKKHLKDMVEVIAKDICETFLKVIAQDFFSSVN